MHIVSISNQKYRVQFAYLCELHPCFFPAAVVHYVQQKQTEVFSMSEIKKVVLAYSGGLDTSIIIPWLKE